jgi:excisionase family DNA binding protein
MERTSDSPSLNMPALCSVPQAARYLAIGRSTVYGLMDAGKLRYVKLGRSRRVKIGDVLALIERNTIGGDGACACDSICPDDSPAIRN